MVKTGKNFHEFFSPLTNMALIAGHHDISDSDLARSHTVPLSACFARFNSPPRHAALVTVLTGEWCHCYDLHRAACDCPRKYCEEGSGRGIYIESNHARGAQLDWASSEGPGPHIIVLTLARQPNKLIRLAIGYFLLLAKSPWPTGN